MFPGMNSRQAKQIMRKMGIQQQEIDATEVVIKTPDKEIVITNPQVAKINMMGQQTYQIAGDAEERPKEQKSRESSGQESAESGYSDYSGEPEINTEINKEDIQTVMEQAGVDEDKAAEAIKKHSGNLAAAIIELKGGDEE